MDLPKNIVVDRLPGPSRGKYPALYFRDEPVWSPDRTHLALAYTICEASMCNEVGCILWAEVSGSTARIIENPDGVLASCWQSPWCRWLSEEVFVFKSQKHNGRTICVPAVVVHMQKGFQVLEGTNSAEQWLEPIPQLSDAWHEFSPTALNAELERCAQQSPEGNGGHPTKL